MADSFPDLPRYASAIAVDFRFGAFPNIMRRWRWHDATNSDANPGLTYAGLTTQAQLSAAKAKVMFWLLWDGEGSLGAISSSADGAKVVPAGRPNLDGVVLLVARLERKWQGDVVAGSSVAKTVNSMVSMNETRSGTVSGTLTMTGSIDDTAGTGQITVTLVNFNDGDGFTQEGAATLRVAGYDTTQNVMTDATLSFSVWTVRSATSDVSLNGSMRIQESASQSGTLTINLDGRDNLSKETFRFDNFVVQHGYDSQSPPSATESYRGRIYLEALGYVVLSSESPCNWGSSNIAVATISNQPGSQGKASSIASGTTTIHAISGAVSGTTTLSVSNWEPRDPGTEADLYRVVWTGAQFVVAGANDFLLFRWKTLSATLILPGALYDVAWSGAPLLPSGRMAPLRPRPMGQGG